MSKFYALKMAQEVAMHPMIKKKDRLFGLLHNVVYKPTDSIIESYSNYYTEEDALLFKNLIESSEEQFNDNIKMLTNVNCAPNAKFRLDLCISHDGKFVAMQLNHVTEDSTTHITSIRYFEGEKAEKVDNIF